MKELSIEQKAKAYDKAVQEAFIAYKDEDKHLKATLERIFPELKESEDDRIRKGIYNALKYLETVLSWDALDYGVDILDAYEWLEKQGEEPQGKSALEAAKEEKVDNQNCVNPTDKNEPEFHEGEWVVYNHDICQIVKREEGCNKLVTVFGIEKELVNERNLSTAHLWTIQDAKEGDVLVYKGDVKYSNGVKYERICLFKNPDNAFFTLTKTSNYKEEYDIDVNIDYLDNIVPATKEQRDLLFQKMAEAGYEWNASKKELKKIEDEPENYKQQLMSEITDLVEDYISQKPTWSEKDEKKLSDIISILGGGENCYYNSPILIDWLKSLKEKIGG